MIIGYGRVSTDGQNLDLQLEELKPYNIEKWFLEKITGKKKERNEYQKMIQYLRPGDTVVVYRLSRLGRNARELIEIMEDIFMENKIHFISVLENIDLSTAQGRKNYREAANQAEYEVDLISENTKKGLAAARRRGKFAGRPCIDPKKISIALKMYRSNEFTIKEITDHVGISKNTLYNYLKKNENKKG